MAILCFEWITTVIKCKLIIRIDCGTQELSLKSNLRKISGSFRVKEKYKYYSFCRGEFVLSASELMKCSSDYVVHNNGNKYGIQRTNEMAVKRTVTFRKFSISRHQI